MVINTNGAALQGARHLNEWSARLRRSIAHLSSGSRITSPEEDAAGLAMSAKLNSENLRHHAAMGNLQNALSLSQTQDGYLQKVEEALDRMGELAVLAQDATKTNGDRTNYDSEFQALKGLIGDTFNKDFNEMKLFSAGQTFNTNLIEAGAGQQNNVVDTQGDSGTIQLNWDFFGDADRITVYYPSQSDGGALLFDTGTVTGTGSTTISFGPGASTEIEIKVNEGAAGTAWSYTASITASKSGDRNVTTDGQGTTFLLPSVSPVSVAGSLTSITSAASALTSVKNAINGTATRRARVGSTIARLQSHQDELSILTENLAAAQSRITDVDVATESTQLARSQIMSNVGLTVLTQANTSPQRVLRLLGF